MKGELLLASRSPRRREILEAAGYRFRVCPPEEAPEVSEGRPAHVARVNARDKCRALAGALSLKPGQVVLGADTVVVLDRQVLGKPRSAAEARRMIQGLQGRWHRVVTGIWLRAAGGDEAAVVTSTRVRVQAMSAAEVRAYVASGEGDDKAGAYGIQGRMACWIDRVSGCYHNVVGLSPHAVRLGIERLGRRAADFMRGC